MCIFYHSFLSRAAEKRLKFSSSTYEKHYWDTFAPTLFFFFWKQECRYLLIQLFEYIFTYLNILYCIEFLYGKNHLQWFDMCLVVPESMCHASLDVSKLHSSDMADEYTITTFPPFLPVYFSFAAFWFLYSLIQYPGLWQ